MLQNTSTSSTAGQQQMPQPKLVVIRRRPNQGFGFTLRHFIAYPPEDDPSWPQEASEPYQVKAMETIFIKEVHPNGPAYYANLQTGDRVLMVNNTPIAGIAYSNIVSMIKQTPSELKLLVVPKECDVLQMHYTSIAHTPQSNVTNVGNGNSASSASNNPNTNFSSISSSSSSSGALLPLSVAMVGKPFPVQHQQHQLISFPASQQASRSGSITSTNSLRPLTNSDYMDIATAQSYHHQQQQLSGNMLTHSDSGSYLRSPPANLTVLTRQQQLQQQQNAAAFYASNAAVDTSDLMIRLRESIKQKEEFLKSPLPNVHQQHNSQHQQHHHQQQQQQHFFPNTPPSGSPQLSMISTSSTSVGSSGLGGAVIRNNEATARGQVRTLVKQPLSATSSSSSTRELLTASCDMHYAPNLGSSTTGVATGLVGVGGGAGGITTYGTSGTSSVMTRGGGHLQQQQRSSATSTTTNGSSSVGSTLRNKCHHKDYEFLETLQETGVTNKVFESKLNSHLSRGFDPFKTLSINTNTIESTAAPGNVIMMKKPGVLYDSLQHHPLAQMQVQQQQPQQQQQHHMLQQHQQQYQQTSAPKMTIIPIAVDATSAAALKSTTTSTTIPTSTATNQASMSTVDGHRYSRMEIHKASLATATIDHQTNSTSTMTDLTEINKSSTTPVTRRFRPMSSFDEPKHMRRISYLRATNDDYHCETSLSSSSVTNTSTGSVNDSLSTKSATVLSQQIEEHPDPIYDVVGGGGGDSGAADSTSESLDALEDLKLETSSRSSRRTSVNSDIRHSVHIDSIPSIDINSKFETKDVATEMEIFETEMEIKSTCINGKRLSEYRSWRLVKIEIKGDILKIYPSRNSKSDNSIIELDIRNYKIFDETDKKKYVFRMQSKPSPIATLGNELNLDDTNDKLTSSSGSSTNVPQQSLQHTDTAQYQPHTEIFFKTKSSTEMRRIFGLVQWKNSLLSYDSNDLQGKQLAEPQKTAATASMSTSTYCDDNVQQQSAQHLQAEHSPLSSTSRSEIEVSDSVSPVMKTRKSSSHKNIPDKDLGSPKAKNWKDLLFRRGGGSSSSGHNADLSPSNLSSSSKTIGSIGVPLKTCPMSKNNEYVPTLVEVCTNIVETKGLGVVGIYRIPGNKAAISELSDQVNKTDFSWDRCNTDVRWEDVNVVSSLLKLFIRSLPDALLPSTFYNHFIEADKKAGMERLREIKQLLENLPRYSYETMKHLFRHLNRVSKNCDVNLMEPKNLAIIFGPSIIRTPNDTLDIAVKDMKHQCRIVELLLTHYDYFFENGKTPDIEDVCGNNLAASTSSATGVTAAQQQQEDQTNMLLHNISKIERFTERESSSSHTTSRTSRFMPQLGKKPRKPGDSRVSEIKSKSFHTSTSNSITTNTNIITNTKHSITTPILLTKNTLKNICKSTPNISTLNTRSISNNHNRKASKAACESAVAYRQRRKAVPTIYDFGVTLRLHFQSTSATTTATSSSSSSSTTTASSTKKNTKKSESRSILGHRHGRKTSLDEKDSGSCSGSSIAKEPQRNSVDISINLTDDESSNSRLSDTGSMSLGAVTDALEDKLKIVKDGVFKSDDENGSPEIPKTPRRYTIGEPLLLHSENIPYADESPERHFHNFYPLDNITGNNLMISRSCASTNTLMNAKMNNEKPTSISTTGSTLTTTYKTTHKLQHSATAPINSSLGSVGGLTSPPTAASTPTSSALKGNLTASTARNLYAISKNLRFSSSVQEQRCSEDDSEGSTTSDPKEALVMASPSFLLDKYNKKRRDHRLFRSASFNCRNYSSRYGGSGAAAGGGVGSNMPTTGLTKDEKTDMNLTKKRQIQNKQNRSIKRRHTVGGPHDYSGGGGAGSNNCNHHCKNISNNGSNNSTASNSATVVRRIPLSSANGNIPNNNINNNNNNMQHDEGGSSSSTSNGNNSSSSNSSSSTNNAATVNVANSAGEHVLEVGIRIKNINRGRF